MSPLERVFMNKLDTKQNLRVMTAYVAAVLYSNFVHKQYDDTSNDLFPYICSGITLLVMVLIVGNVYLMRRKKSKVQIMMVCNTLFIVASLIHMTVRTLSFRTSPPSIYTHLTPFLALLIDSDITAKTLILFVSLLAYALLVQFSFANTIAMMLPFLSEMIPFPILIKLMSHFHDLHRNLLQSGYEEVSILYKQELPMFGFFFMFLYILRRHNEKLKSKSTHDKKKRSLIVTFLDNAPVIMWSFDTSLRLDFCRGRNIASGADQVPLIPPRVVGCDVSEAMRRLGTPENRIPEFRKRHIRVLQGDSFALTEKVADCYVRTILRPLVDENNYITGGLGLSWDVTDVIKTQHELEVSEEKYRTLVESMSDTLIKIDENRVISYINKEFMNMTPNECFSKSLSDLFRHDEQIMEQVKLDLDELFSKMKTCYWEWNCKADITKTFSITASPIVKDGVVVAATILATDISDKILLREKSKLAEQATIASKAKSQFIASISHDIRNPIHAIMGVAQLLTSTTLNELQLEYIEDVVSNSKLLMAIISDVLDMSKIESGQISILEAPVNLLEITEGNAEMFFNQAVEKTIEIICFVDVSLPEEVFGDATRIGQILMNFTVNAIKFTSEGFIVLSAILVSQTEDTARVKFSVLDTGRGISEGDQKKLFKPYIQVGDQVQVRNSMQGYGLGLSIVDKLLSAMNGSAKVSSRQGMGSEFSCEINLRLGNPKPQTIAETIPTSKFKNVVILVKNMALAYVIKSYCHDLGVEDISIVDSDDSTDQLKYYASIYRSSTAIIVDEPLYPDIVDLKTSWKVCVLLCSNKSTLRETFPVAVSFLRKPLGLRSLINSLCDVERVLTLHNQQNAEMLKQEISQRKLSILIVEDSPINRKVLERLLQTIGITKIDVANNGLEGLNKVRDNPAYDVIFLDISMPVMGGLEMAKHVRQLEDNQKASTTIIALTANAWRQSINECLQAGMDDILTKPVSIDTIIEKVRKYT